MTSVAIVLGSIRPGRWGEQVANWVQGSAQEAGFEATIIDLRDFDLPVFAEEMAPSIEAPTQPEGVRFRQALEARDAVIFVTPEYNHSIPGGLKNAIDYLPPSTLKDKSVGLVGYSWSGASKPLQHLREILGTFGTAIRDQQVGLNLGSDFADGVLSPDDDARGQVRRLLASLV